MQRCNFLGLFREGEWLQFARRSRVRGKERERDGESIGVTQYPPAPPLAPLISARFVFLFPQSCAPVRAPTALFLVLSRSLRANWLFLINQLARQLRRKSFKTLAAPPTTNLPLVLMRRPAAADYAPPPPHTPPDRAPPSPSPTPLFASFLAFLPFPCFPASFPPSLPSLSFSLARATPLQLQMHRSMCFWVSGMAGVVFQLCFCWCWLYIFEK